MECFRRRPSIRSLAVGDARRATMFAYLGGGVLVDLVKAAKISQCLKDWESMRLAIECLGLFSFNQSPMEWIKKEFGIVATRRRSECHVKRRNSKSEKR